MGIREDEVLVSHALGIVRIAHCVHFVSLFAAHIVPPLEFVSEPNYFNQSIMA